MPVIETKRKEEDGTAYKRMVREEEDGNENNECED